MSHWYTPVRTLVSRGSQARRPGSLAGLHAARREHQGQFFTGDVVARFVWSIVEPVLERARLRDAGARASLFDNSLGTGRLFQFANPEHHSLYGCDVDKDAVMAFTTAAENAGFRMEIESVGMEAVRPRNSSFSVGLINPPFSLHLESPLLKAFPCTTHGRFGPDSSSLSHAYALHQSLSACDVVVAILPSTFANELPGDPSISDRLVAVYRLPSGSFRDEGTEIDVSVAVFGRTPPARLVVVDNIDDLSEPAPDLGLECRTEHDLHGDLRVSGIDRSLPAITRPVTQNRVVRVVHNGRRIILKFACGLTEGMVLNAVYRDTLDGHRHDGQRYPTEYQYLGQAALDFEVHLAQPDPKASFRALLTTIEEAGGVPAVTTDVWRYLQKRIRKNARARVPFRHVVYSPTGAATADRVTGRARAHQVLDPAVWGSALLKKGDVVEFRKDAGYLVANVSGLVLRLSPDEAAKRFELETTTGGGWSVVHEGKCRAFPALAAAIRKRAVALGIDQWLSWQFQLDDLVEIILHPAGALIGWDPGLGKARLALAIALLSGRRHNLVVLEPHLIPEMERELAGLSIDKALWHIIQSPKDLRRLRRINIISYDRLRSPIAYLPPRKSTGTDSVQPAGAKLAGEQPTDASARRGLKRRTYARLLRRRIGTLIADEGDVARNIQSEQTRALWQVSARRRYLLSATPVSNYPRDVYALLGFSGGDGTALSPYGIRHPYLDPSLLSSTVIARRGQDVFRENFVTMEWVTNLFAEEMVEGAKREIPRIANLPAYRAMLAPWFKRRVTDEPDVCSCIRIPKPNKVVTDIDWDPEHLRYYLAVAEDFRSWYTNAATRAGKKGQNVNLIALLARIRAVQFAANFPQHGVTGFGAYTPLTSKQRYVVDRLTQLTEDGHKTILYAENPGVLDLLSRELTKCDVESVVFDGRTSIKARTRLLDNRFRFGPVPVLLASIGVGQTGLNIPQADRILFYNRAWTAKQEKQAGGRILRPQQQGSPEFEYTHLTGSIDCYMAQMVAHKDDASTSGLDYAAPQLYEEDFLHLDTLLGQFCENLSALYGVEPRDLRARLATA